MSRNKVYKPAQRPAPLPKPKAPPVPFKGDVRTIGIHGRKLEDLLKWLDDHRSYTLVDLRYVTHHSNPWFTNYGLIISIGSRYVHIRELGNINHSDSTLPFDILNLEVGINKLYSLALNYGDVLLMCSCRSEDSCHRHLIVKRLTELGHKCSRLDLDNGYAEKH